MIRSITVVPRSDRPRQARRLQAPNRDQWLVPAGRVVGAYCVAPLARRSGPVLDRRPRGYQSPVSSNARWPDIWPRSRNCAGAAIWSGSSSCSVTTSVRSRREGAGAELGSTSPPDPLKSLRRRLARCFRPRPLNRIRNGSAGERRSRSRSRRYAMARVRIEPRWREARCLHLQRGLSLALLLRAYPLRRMIAAPEQAREADRWFYQQGCVRFDQTYLRRGRGRSALGRAGRMWAEDRAPEIRLVLRPAGKFLDPERGRCPPRRPHGAALKP